jgi:hypothetical protein
MDKLVYFVPEYSLAHLILIRAGWRQLHGLFIDGEIWIKMESRYGTG